MTVVNHELPRENQTTLPHMEDMENTLPLRWDHPLPRPLHQIFISIPCSHKAHAHARREAKIEDLWQE
eukprot:99007-Hanusia_phi.AAC.1